MPVGQQLFVIHVVPGNTMINQHSQVAKRVQVANIKIKARNLPAKHVPVVLTALLELQVVHILQLLVLLEPMPVVHQPYVIHVVLANTTINKDNQVVHHVALGNTTISKDNLVVQHVVLEHTMTNKDNLVVNHVVLENTTA